MSESGFDVLVDTRQSIALLRSVATRSESDPDIRNQLFSGDDFDAFDATFDRVRTSGFTAEEIGRFHDAASRTTRSVAYASATRVTFSASGLSSDSTLADALRGLADGLEPTLEPTEAFARNASAVAGETNQPPSASFDPSRPRPTRASCTSPRRPPAPTATRSACAGTSGRRDRVRGERRAHVRRGRHLRSRRP